MRSCRHQVIAAERTHTHREIRSIDLDLPYSPLKVIMHFPGQVMMVIDLWFAVRLVFTRTKGLLTQVGEGRGGFGRCVCLLVPPAVLHATPCTTTAPRAATHQIAGRVEWCLLAALRSVRNSVFVEMEFCFEGAGSGLFDSQPVCVSANIFSSLLRFNALGYVGRNDSGTAHSSVVVV